MSFRPAVLACGMTTAIGLDAPSSCAALRARLDRFAETRFISRDGVWITGAEVPLQTPWRGLARHVHLLVGPIRECLAWANAAPDEIPFFLCVAEPERAGRVDGLNDRLGVELQRELDCGFHPASEVLAYGPVGGTVALDQARQLIASGTAPAAIVAGVDSLLTAGTLRAYDRNNRLLTEANSDGFIAGEAGAALLVGPAERNALTLLGIGYGVEAATLDSGEPLRADGLTMAMRGALTAAGLEFEQIDYRIGDLSGEHYYFKEAVLAKTRLLRGPRDVQELWHPTDGFGYTGAAAIPLMLGVSLTAGREGYAPGPIVLAQAANDDGQRAVMVLRMEG